MKSIVANVKKTIILRLDAGDDLLLSIKKCAEEHNIKCGSFVMIGGLKEMVYGLYEDRKYRNIKKTAKHCFELLTTAGNITMKEGAVLIHSHVSAADEEDGAAFGGHLMEGTIVGPFAEIVIQELDANIDRTLDQKLNLWPMKL